MSCFVSLGDQDVWNPSNAVARIFLGQSKILEDVFNEDSGVGCLEEDEVQIDTSLFVNFVYRLVCEYDRSNNSALQGLIEGFLSISLVLLNRAQHPLSQFAESAEYWQNRVSHFARSMPM
jgi:hypothetical protein